MKKIVLALIVVVLFMSTTTVSTTELQNADCFEIAFEDLDNFEAGLGFNLNEADATEYVNDSYAICECMLNDNCYWFD